MKTRGTDTPPSIGTATAIAAEAGSHCPLTPMQMGMVYESTLARRPWVNLEQIVVQFEDEDIDVTALRAAWQAVATQHEALRLSILWRKRDVPVQVIRPHIDIDLTYEDWSQMSPNKQQITLDQVLATDRERGVDLEAAPPWRVQLFRLGPRQSVMIWTVHHAFIDGRSMTIVLEDLFETLAGRPMPSEADHSVGFSHYCRALLTSDTAAAKAHFQQVLADFDQPNALTHDPQDTAQTSALRKQQIHRQIDPALSAALVERAEAAGATLADLIHAAWGMVVARWTGRDEAVIGITRSGRYIAPDCQRTVGCLINTLPLRMQMTAGKQADLHLADLRRATLALRPYEHAALTDIRRWAGIPGSVPLFETMVMFERQSLNQSMRALGPEWHKRRVTLHEEGAMPVTLAVYADREMLIEMEHDPALVPANRARAMLKHLVELLASFAKAPGSEPLSLLKMLPRAEEAALLSLGRPERRLPPLLPCLATLLNETAKQAGAAPALSMVGERDHLSHEAMNQKANGLAHDLVAQGARPGQIVAICLERSPGFVIAMLAVLKSGAAFLPVDPSYPPDVIAHMLTDSGASLIIARPGHLPAQTTGLRVIAPDAAPAQSAPPLPPPDPDRLAYVIYTSGSTGVPKGVKVPMRAITAHAAAIGAEFGLSQDDRVLQFASLSFDVSIEEILPTLLAGAHLVLRDEAMVGGMSAFLSLVGSLKLTVLNLPTAFWHVLVDDMAQNGHHLPPSVRLVIVGGEQINPRALATWQRLEPKVRWLNGYGPTETTITCTLHEPGPVSPGDDIPIGKPTAHACAYVLAADGSLAPMGAAGDLWIGGPAVSDGYINRPEENAAAFQPDRFTGQGRIYRTGDRASWRADETLAFLGRQDRQVKLRGFRLDLRHVERVLEQDDRVGRALALVLAQGTPEARLVAWATGADGQAPPDPEQLRQAVARRLPGHMVPKIMVLNDFPRTPGGKIDKSALPVPKADKASADVGAEADEVTLHIARLMARTLGFDQIGPDDNFHDLGGHSLQAVRLIGQIETELGYRLGIGDLHRNPTPRQLADTVDAAQTGPRYIVPVQPNGTLPPLFGVHVLGRNEEYYRPLAAALGPDQPVLGLTVGLLTQDTPIGVEATARCYFEDIQRHYPDGPISLAAVSLGSYIAFDLAQQLLDAGREVRMIALFDAEGPGGRSRVRGLARLMVHVRRLRGEGAAYLLHVLSNRLTDLRNRVEKARVKMASAKGEAAPLTIGTFVAANELAVQAYEAQPIELPLTIFRATENVFDSPESSRDGLGWSPVAQAGFEVIDIPGGHLTMLSPPHVARLARHMAQRMARRD
ncbi:non-ribosomal peptide synthetase [Pseudotabrizicola sp. L79]|uniref:non-ribosomal peptide synthetase n=1 Tax=Pseudotabrizicola sp. L79 TaxID=3118402 RepID=UPI002F95F83C